MDIKSLKQFLSLSESLHFGRSSEACHVSPSTLSRTIKQLEEALGVELFERDNRTVRLTRQGQVFQAYAREALMQWDVLRNTLMAEGGELQGEISLFCSVTASYSFLYDILSEFRLNYPRIEIKLHTGDPALAIPRVLAGEEDITIGPRPDSLPQGLAFKPIAVSPLVFIAPSDPAACRALLGDSLAVADWSSVPMILSEEGLARKRVDAWFRKQGIKPRVYAQVGGNEAIVSMVGLGFGVGVVPKIVLDNSPLVARTQILGVSPELEPYDVGLCVLEKRLKSPLISALWAQVKG